MPEIEVEIIRYVDDAQPGWVECHFTDAARHEHVVIDKVPLFTALALDAASQYPVRGTMGCREVGRRHDADGREIVTIDTEEPDHIASTSGQTRFDVVAVQLVEA